MAVETLEYEFVNTPFGACLLATTARGICHLEFVDGDNRAALRNLADRWDDTRRVAAAVSLQPLADAIFSTADESNPALDPQGTPFQLQVWECLRLVPRGQTLTYGEIAARLGRPRAARAVGAAIAANRIAGAIPCHRVICADGSLGGFRWGEARKAAMLAAERVPAATPDLAA